MKLSLIVAVAVLALAHGTVPPSRLVSFKCIEVEKHSHFIDLGFFVCVLETPHRKLRTGGYRSPEDQSVLRGD